MVPKTGTIFLGRDRASRVTSAPRGLGLYGRAGREGFFYVKNLAAQAKRYPGRFKTTYVDEQIKSATGELVTTQKQAEADCHCRNAEIEERLLSPKGEFISYSGSDLEAIAQTLADKWIRGQQRGLNLQERRIYEAESTGGTSGWIIKTFILKLIKRRHFKGRVLDYWCGKGELLEELSKKSLFEGLCGTDIVERPANLSEHIVCYQPDLNESLQINNEPSNLVICSKVIEHLETHEQLSEMFIAFLPQKVIYY